MADGLLGQSVSQSGVPATGNCYYSGNDVGSYVQVRKTKNTGAGMRGKNVFFAALRKLNHVIRASDGGRRRCCSTK